MAFNFRNNVSGRNSQSLVYLPTTASETYTVGELLVLSSGKLTKCDGTKPPTYISAAYYVAPATGMKDIPVGVALETDEYIAAEGDGDFSSVVPGEVLSLGSDGLTVLPTTAAGYFTVIENLGDTIRGKFDDRVAQWATSALASFTAITLTQTGGAGGGDTEYQTAAAVIAALPTSVVVTLVNGTTAAVPVTWADTDSYDPDSAAAYTFTATWGTMPTGANDNNSLAEPTVEVTVAA